MSFGSLSKNAVLALNKGAKMGGFALIQVRVESVHTTLNQEGFDMANWYGIFRMS